MTIKKKYICVVCGNNVDALFRQYGPTVLKVTNCDKCGSVSDKYIEYDPVIVMVDMVLLSKQAYRHVLYNTSFKTYWKLFIFLLLMETYLDWSNHNAYYEKLKTSLCNIQKSINPELDTNLSSDIQPEQKNEKMTEKPKNICDPEVFDELKKAVLNDDPFFTEKGLYLTFGCVCVGMVVFLATSFALSSIFASNYMRRNRVEFILLVKGLTLGGMGNFFMLPTIIWGTEHDTSIHAPLVLGYTSLAIINIHSVIFECNKTTSVFIIGISFILKIWTRAQVRIFLQTL